MCRPNLIVYLDVNPDRSMERIRSRARNVETGISAEYLEALYTGYEEFLADISRTIPVVRVDYDRFRTVEEMAAAIDQAYNQGSFLQEVRWDPTQS